MQLLRVLLNNLSDDLSKTCEGLQVGSSSTTTSTAPTTPHNGTDNTNKFYLCVPLCMDSTLSAKKYLKVRCEKSINLKWGFVLPKELSEFKAVTTAKHMSGLYINMSIPDVYR